VRARRLRRHPSVFLCFAIACLLSSPPVGSQGPERPSEAFTGETTVLAVEVPVRVLRDGQPLRGLTAENFVVYDEDERRELVGFEVVDLEELTAAPAEGRPAEVPTAARRHFLLLFDLDFTDARYLKRAHEAARELVEGGLQPSDLVAVAFFSNRAGASSVLGFTTDHSQVRAALDGLGRFLGEEGVEAPDARVTADALGITVGGWQAAAADLGMAAEREQSLAGETLEWWVPGGGGGKTPDGITETIADMEDYALEDMQQKRAARASAMVGALGHLADQYRWIDGEKYLVLFSRGFESDLYLADGGSWLLREVRGMLDRFRKAGWSIYSIEGLETNTADARARREALTFLARETGGSLIGARNDLSVSMARVLMQTSVTYLVTFQSPELPADGSFRRLRVELAGAPRGSRVFHRAGYFVPRPYAELTEAERRASSADLVLSGRELDELGAGVFAGATELASGRVPLLVELDRIGLLAGEAERPAGAEIHAYALDGEGRVVDLVSQRVMVAPEKLEQNGLKFLGELRLPPGRYDLRVLVRSLRTGLASLSRVPLEVPAAGRGPILVSPLFIQGANERWLLVRQAARPDEEAGDGDDAYPFLVSGQRFVPAIRGDVAAGEEAQLLLMGFGLTEDHMVLESRVLDRSGEALEGGSLSFLTRMPGDDGRPDQLVLAFDPQGLAPGDYTLELTLGDPDAGRLGVLEAPVRVLAR
jgi:VWFA-related protein